MARSWEGAISVQCTGYNTKQVKTGHSYESGEKISLQASGRNPYTAMLASFSPCAQSQSSDHDWRLPDAGTGWGRSTSGRSTGRRPSPTSGARWTSTAARRYCTATTAWRCTSWTASRKRWTASRRARGPDSPLCIEHQGSLVRPMNVSQCIRRVMPPFRRQRFR